MELLEYQVKEWFGKIGIPVLPSQTIDHPTDLKRLKINYPIVLKSQVYGGGRAKAGGVRFVETTIDAIAAAQNIFNLSIYGQLPEMLLAEAKYNIEQELYLAIVLDTAVCRPILLGCHESDFPSLVSTWGSRFDFLSFPSLNPRVHEGTTGGLQSTVLHVCSLRLVVGGIWKVLRLDRSLDDGLTLLRSRSR